MRSVLYRFVAVFTLLSAVYPPPAFSDCPKYNTLPRAREGVVGYDKTDKCIFLCDGIQWQTQCPTVTNPGCTGICVPGSDQTSFNVCFEAEDPANTGVNSIVDTTTPPGGKMRSSFGNSSEYLDFAPFTIPETAYYTLDIYYASAEDPSAGITPNGGTLQTLYLGTSYIQSQFISWSTVAKKSVNIPLNQGSNNLRIAGTNSGGAFSLDKICIHNDAPIDYCASGTTWQTSAWDSCSASCGGGTQTRSVSCLGSDGATVCPNAKCTGAMPAVSQTCNTHGCCNPSAYRTSFCGSWWENECDGSKWGWDPRVTYGPQAGQDFSNRTGGWLHSYWNNAPGKLMCSCFKCNGMYGYFQSCGYGPEIADTPANRSMCESKADWPY